MASFWKNLKKCIIKIFGQMMAFLVQCVTLATTELKQCWRRLQLSFRANIFWRGDILFPLKSSQVDEQTAFQINKKKAYRIPFQNVPIRPRPLALVMSSKEANIWNEKGTQTRNSGCHCFPVSSKGTCVKICTVAECTTKQDTCPCRNHP